MAEVRPPSKSDGLRGLLGAVALAIDIVSWWAFPTLPLWARILAGALALVLLASFLLPLLRFLRASWRRSAGFYRVLDAEIAEGERHVRVAYTHPTEYEGWEFWTEVLEWDRRVYTILASYGGRLSDIYRPGSEKPLAEARDDPTGGPDPEGAALERRLKRLQRIRSMGPPS